MRKRNAAMVLALLCLAAGLVALGCGAAGIGFGSLGFALAGFIAWALLAAGSSSGCYSSYRDDDGGDDAGELGVCLTAPWDADVGPCLGAPLDAGPCLEAPLDVGPCLDFDPDVGPCLRYDPDATLPETGPCLMMPADDGAGELPTCPPELCDVCLGTPIDWCVLDCPPPGSDASASLVPAPGARQRLAAAGVLTPEQVARLRKLSGRG